MFSRMPVANSNNSNSKELIPALDLTYGLLCATCMVLGTIGNGYAFHYFITLPRRSLSSFLYTCISFVDLLISVAVLPVAVSYLGHRRPLIFGSTAVCNTWGYVFHALTLFSVFYVGVLSITRAYVLLHPLYKIRKRSIVTLIIAHFIGQAVFSSLLFWDNGRYTYKPEYVECSALQDDHNHVLYVLTEHVIGMVTYVLPALPILSSSGICIWKLYGRQVYHAQVYRRDGRGRERVRMNVIYGPFERWMQRGNIKQMLRNKRDASLTIVVFTIVYAVCNIPMGVYYVLHVTESFQRGTTFFNFDKPGYYIENMIFNLAVPINSLCNPIIYLFRMSEFRRRALGRLRRVLLYRNRRIRAMKNG